MRLFGRKEHAENQRLRQEVKRLRIQNRQLKALCAEKDSFFREMIADGLRHGSPLAGKHMADRKKYLRGK